MTGAVAGGSDLTAGFLTRALAARFGGVAVTTVELVRVGTGQVSDTYRLHLTYDAAGGAGLDAAAPPATMIAKVPAADPASRGAARAFRTYEIEASFYRELAPGLPVALPECFYAAYDAAPDEYVVLLADLGSAEPGDQLAGLSPDDAAAAIGELAALHAAGWEPRGPGRAALAESVKPGRCGSDGRRGHRSVSGIPGPVRRAPRSGDAWADRGVPPAYRPVPGWPGRAEHGRPRRLPGGQPAVRAGAAGRARLADRELRRGHRRPGLLPRAPACSFPSGRSTRPIWSACTIRSWSAAMYRSPGLTAGTDIAGTPSAASSWTSSPRWSCSRPLAATTCLLPWLAGTPGTRWTWMR